MSSDRRKNRLLFDNDIEEVENMEIKFQFHVSFKGDITEYESPEFVLHGTDLHCHVVVKLEDNIITFSLHINDDYKNFCVNKPWFHEIVWFTKEQGYKKSVPIIKENPTLEISKFHKTLNFYHVYVVSVRYKIKNYENTSDENLTMLFNLQNMYNDEIFTDLIINVEGEEFSAHKALQEILYSQQCYKMICEKVMKISFISRKWIQRYFRSS